MSWEAIRAFAAEVQRREKEGMNSNDRNSNRWYYARAVTAAREAQALLKELDRAVELLMRAASVVLADEARKQQHHPLSTVARNRPTLASEIMDFLHELEARQC